MNRKMLRTSMETFAAIARMWRVLLRSWARTDNINEMMRAASYFGRAIAAIKAGADQLREMRSEVTP